MNGLAEQLAALLQDYSAEVTEVTKAAVDATAEAVYEEIKAHAPERKGKYQKAFALKTSYESNLEKRKTWYVKAPHYRLTHLLEYGHLNRDGSRTKAIPHIEYGQQIAEKMLEEKITEGIEKI